MINVLKNPIFLMLISVGLWMLYPFISNKTVEDLGVFPFAFLAHSCAAIAMVVVSLSFGLIEQIKKLCVKDLSPVMFPTIVSGFLIGINHLFLYWALDTTSNLDVIATLIFEIWPILFFFIDSRLRRGERHISMYKIAYSGLAFSGVLVLSLPGFLSSTIDSSSIFTVATLSGLGGLAMAFNCYFRMKCMEAWARIEESNKSISLGIFKRGMLTEMFVRVMGCSNSILGLSFIWGKYSSIRSE